MKKSKRLLEKIYRVLKDRGLRTCILRSLEKLFYTNNIGNSYHNKDYILGEIEDNYTVKVSIVVPVYNTPIKYLKEMIESVLNQTYFNIELCLFNGGSDKKEIDDMIKQYQAGDSRIIYRLDNKNYGISENTNCAIAMATGQYIGLLDHDDVLAPNAVEECIKAIILKDADVIYSDEDKITKDGKYFVEPHIKPDWSPDTLKSHNYICHFLVFRASLLKKVGLLRSCFDGSQDYDLIIRLTRKAKVIYHIPLILYHWRISEQSTASNVQVKSYAVKAGKRVLEQAIRDEGLNYKVEYGVCLGTYNLKQNLNNEPMITIIVIGKWKNQEQLIKSNKKLCINTNYPKYKEIWINQSSSELLAIKENMIVINMWNKSFYEVLYEAMDRADTEYVIIKSDKIKIETCEWCKELVGHAQEDYIAIVAPKILMSKKIIYSFGVSIIDNKIINNFQGYHKEFYGYMGRNTIAQNVESVSKELFLIKKSIWNVIKDTICKNERSTGVIEICAAVRNEGYYIKVIPHEIGILYNLWGHTNYNK